MALCITHTNNNDATYPIQVMIKYGSKDVETINLAPNQEFWTESNAMTSSLRVYQRKALIKITQDDGKIGMTFLTPYTIGDKTEKLKQDHVAIEAQEKPKPNETSISSILGKASQKVEEYTKSDLKTGKWDEEELSYLKKHYPKNGAKYVAEKLNRGEKSVSKKAEALKIKRKR